MLAQLGPGLVWRIDLTSYDWRDGETRNHSRRQSYVDLCLHRAHSGIDCGLSRRSPSKLCRPAALHD
jgi:hypothetical protein